MIKAQQESIDGLVVLIKADTSNLYGNLVEVLDVMSYMNVKRYALAPLTDFDKELARKEDDGN